MISIDASDITVHLGDELMLDLALAKAFADKLALDLLAGLKMATPVDTGFARNSWIAETAQPIPEVSTTCVYMNALNNGHSAQAPSGFIENEIDRISAA